MTEGPTVGQVEDEDVDFEIEMTHEIADLHKNGLDARRAEPIMWCFYQVFTVC